MGHLAGTWLRRIGLTAVAFAGGAVSSHLAGATSQTQSPYAPIEQLARALALVENQYVEPAQRNKLIEGAVKGMVAELDPHSAFMTAEEFSQFQEETGGRFGGVGVEVDYRNETPTVIAPIEGSPAERAGIRSGDQIVAIDGKPTRGERLDKLITLMRGPAGSKVRVLIRRPGVTEPLNFELKREEIRVTSVVAKRMEHDVAYIRLKQFQEGTHEELLQAAGKLRAASKSPLAGVILDMRNNPGGLVDEAEGVADEFLGSGTIYSTRHRNVVVDEARATPGGAFSSLPIVVLVNEYSASSSELVAGALQDNKRATVIGTTTFGKGSVQTIYELPGGAGMRLTTMRYYTPSGRSIQAQGVQPDVVVQAAKGDKLAEVMRESDLEGHLAPEGASGGKPRPVLVGGGEGSEISRDVPADPRKGKDFVLSLGYETLLKEARKGR
ncbi:S41 family peptidase [Chondromyces crocatus]|uniref:Peptidase S41 n=1 Tax=Chondromyces crocatus TaxID=52 RepID=A0A0K1E5T5_CHOCO|nr:S41 family peptidase [Chondromyces crocatus]AKT36236.1 peptidase S41 [Chondromyces crocatus]